MKKTQLSIRFTVVLVLLATTLMTFIPSGQNHDFMWAKELNMPTTQPANDQVTSNPKVAVKVFNKQGQLVGPVWSEIVSKTPAQWKKQLGQQRFDILRQQGTEPPGSSQWLSNKVDGVYTCVGCDLPLFDANTKFESGTGWPSYFNAILPNVAIRKDKSQGIVRKEIHCARCNGHLGHVFEDGPKPTGLRYCVDGLSLNFTSADQFASLADPAAQTTPIDPLATAVFAGGCFWCTEAVFEPVNGVQQVVSGYAGGSEKNAHYNLVSSGKTNHAEAIQITYDPKVVSYDTLLELFFTVAHDPTQLNRQGNDVGTQYRSAVFVSSDQQRKHVKNYIDKLQASGKFNRPIVTTIEPLTEFYQAEKYHQDYVRLNPSNPYVQQVALPKVKKLVAQHSDLLKKSKRLQQP